VILSALIAIFINAYWREQQRQRAPGAAAISAILQSLAATLDVPVPADDLTTDGRHRALTGGKLARDRQRRILRIITRNTPIERKGLHPATPLLD
jgi:predicted membrane metal-binding protein